MTKSQRTQLKMTEEMEAWVDRYKEEKGFQYRTEAIIDLLAFAIRIKENAKDDDTISNRELLEEILYRTIMTEKVSRTNIVYDFDMKFYEDKERMASIKNMLSDFEKKSKGMTEEVLTKS